MRLGACVIAPMQGAAAKRVRCGSVRFGAWVQVPLQGAAAGRCPQISLLLSWVHTGVIF